MRLKRLLFLIAGFICLGIGGVGVVLPILPTFPFFLATVFFFSQSSQRLHDWFVGTKLYKKHVEPFLQKKGMTAKTKACILITVTLLMAFGFVMMKSVPVGRLLLAIVWGGHLIYFLFGVKTMREEAVEVALED